jgi:predicted RNase H-like HicB family nuclease
MLRWSEVVAMANPTYIVQATWDDAAKVWVADSDDIPGIAAEAEDQEKLRAKLAVLIPEMIELNHVEVDPTQPLEIVIRYHQEDRLRLPVAA